MRQFHNPFSNSGKGSLGLAIIFIVIMLWGLYLLYSSEPRKLNPPPINSTPVEQRESSDAANGIDFTASIIRTISVTGVIIIVILLMARWYRKKAGVGRTVTKLKIEVLGRHYLSAQHSLMMVKIADRKLLLGITDSAINLITEFESDSETEISDLTQPTITAYDSFGSLLARFRKAESR